MPLSLFIPIFIYVFTLVYIFMSMRIRNPVVRGMVRFQGANAVLDLQGQYAMERDLLYLLELNAQACKAASGRQRLSMRRKMIITAEVLNGVDQSGDRRLFTTHTSASFDRPFRRAKKHMGPNKLVFQIITCTTHPFISLMCWKFSNVQLSPGDLTQTVSPQTGSPLANR